MLENPRSAVENPTSALGPSDSSFGPSSIAPVGIHHLLLSNLTTADTTACRCRPTLRVSPACDFVYWLIIPSTCTTGIQLRRDMIQLTRSCSRTALLDKRLNYVQHNTTKSLLTPLAYTTTHWINDGRAYTHSQPQ